MDTAYYLIHSMATSRHYATSDRRGAEAFARAAREAGVRRIIYLGGLGDGDQLSRHLASRQQVGRILRESGVPTIEFRASIVIGSGSLSFELVRALVEKLPIMLTPRWVESPSQPIGVEDLVAYLVAALDLPKAGVVVYEVGGPDRVSYGDLMREYARLRGLRRVMIPVPALTPSLSGLWLGLVTPVYAQVGRELIEGVRNPTVVRDDRALRDFSIRPRGIREVLARALVNEDLGFAATRWSDALSSRRVGRGWGGVRFGSRRVDSRAAWVDLSPGAGVPPDLPDRRPGGLVLRRPSMAPARAARPCDRRAGMRRGRREADTLSSRRRGGLLEGRSGGAGTSAPSGGGDAAARAGVAAVRGDAGGRGESDPPDRALRPRRPAGLLYWYALWGIHRLVFAGMLRNIARAAAAGGDPPLHRARPQSVATQPR